MFGRLGEIINAIVLLALFLFVLWGIEQVFGVSFGLSYSTLYDGIGDGLGRFADLTKTGEIKPLPD